MSVPIKKARTHLHLDVVGGIAGDMFCAAVLDAWPELTHPLLNVLTTILPQHCGLPKVWADKNAGMHVMRFALDDTHVKTHAHKHNHDNKPSHEGEHNHSHHTTYIALKKRIEQSDLTPNVIIIAVDVLTILAKAESKMHAVAIEQVHFHELADWDSLMDVVAAAFLIDALALYSVSFSDLPLGHGLVKTQHGLLPVPAPATTEILKGFTCRDDGIAGERITPTGAAILRYLHTHINVEKVARHTLVKQGFGGGSRALKGMPNLLRLAVFEPIQNRQQDDLTQDNLTQDNVTIIETDIDDMTGEELAVACDILREENGVIDVTVTHVHGKKNRAAERITLLCQPLYRDAICSAVFLQTSTLGVRMHDVNRKVLSREQHQKEYNGVNINVKQVTRPTCEQTTKAESDSLKEFSTLAIRRAAKHHTER